MAAERVGTIEKLTKISKTIDVFTIGAGFVIAIFNPEVGMFLVIGSVLTYIPADIIEKRLKRK